VEIEKGDRIKVLVGEFCGATAVVIGVRETTGELAIRLDARPSGVDRQYGVVFVGGVRKL
jgi:transcription antitermination factor NusG